MNVNAATLIARIPESATSARQAAELALNTAAEFARQHEEIRRSGTHTAAGIKQALHGSLPASLKKIGFARSSAEKLRREAEGKRASLRPAPLDKGDLVGAIEHQEARTFLRNLQPNDRAALLVGTNDRRLLEAALLAPPELSLGTNPDQNLVSQIEASYGALVDPTAVADAAALDNVADELVAIVDVALGSLRQTAEMDQRVFDQEVKKSAGRIWLVGDAGREQVCEIDADGKASYRQPTADELAAGVKYGSLAEYLKDA
jgi:hypothetical protein